MTRAYLIIAAALLMIAGSFWRSAFAENDLPLIDDASRGELFEIMRGYLERQAPAPEREQFAFKRSFTFPHDALYNNPADQIDPRINQIFGVDVSHHNADRCSCRLDWAAMQHQKVAFAYLKVSQGTKYYDKKFDTYLSDIRNLPPEKKIHVGPYHFLSADGSGADQADYFLSKVRNKFGSRDFPPVLDLEWDIRKSKGRVVLGDDKKPYDYWTPKTGDEIINSAVSWLNAVAAKTHRVPIVYTNREWWKQRVGSETKFHALKQYGIWIADYSETGRAMELPSVPNNDGWSVWQFTAWARFTSGGLPTGQIIDANVFKGTQQDFLTAFGLPK